MAKKNSKIKPKKGRNILPNTEATPALWNPFDVLGEANRLFRTNDPWASPWLKHWGLRGPWAGPSLRPGMKEVPIDIIDTGKEFKIIAEMPGVAKEDIEITVTPRRISICGKTETEVKDEEEGYIRQERNYSTLCRNMVFPEEVNPDKAEASLKEGILEVNVAKKTPVKGKGRKVPVK